MTRQEKSGECLNELFRNIHDIHELTNQLVRYSNTLREISVNAAIASGHANSQGKVFSEIAKQIGVISGLVMGFSNSTEMRTSAISAHVLDCIVKFSQRDKFDKAYRMTQGQNNQELVAAVRETLCRGVAEKLAVALSQLSYLKPEQERLKQIINRIWSIVISLRVAAGVADAGEDVFLLSIAEALEKLTTDTTKTAEELFVIVARSDFLLSNKCYCKEGELYAA